MRREGRGRWLGWVLPCALLAAWFLSTQLGLLPPYLLPSPQRLFLLLADFVTGFWGLGTYAGTFLFHLAASLRRVAVGFAMASALGTALGFLCGRSRILLRLLDPLLGAIRAVPGVGWLPVAIIWFGIGEGNTLFLICLAAFFPVYLNTVQAASRVSPQLLRAGQMLGAGRWALFCSVTLPGAFPQIVVGLRLGLGVSWAYLVLGEMTGVSRGLGAVMADSRMLGRIDMVLVCVVLIAAAGKLTDLLLVKLCGAIYGRKGALGGGG